MNIRSLVLLLTIFTLFSCEKTQVPINTDPVYELYVDNSYNELTARFAVFVSDQNTGESRAFRWVPGEDSVLVQVPGSKTSDRFDCTVLKTTILVAPGSGVRDTLLSLTTYTNLGSGEQINLRSQVFQQTTTLKFKLTGMNTLDSITVPDAYVISRPTANNNYAGEYFSYNSGKCWMRILVNQDPFWRFVRFDDVSNGIVDANALNVNLFLSILSPPLKLNFPFVADWEYKVDGVVDTAQLKFFPLSGQLRVPGGALPVLDAVDIFEPVNNDVFDPNRPYDGLRVQTRGTESTVGGYTYISDHFYSAIPATLPVPAFDLQPTILSDKRLVAVQCLGDFDLLAFSRIRSIYGKHLNIAWEVVTKPRDGVVSYRLPDVPTPLGDLYLPLKVYDFNAGVRARAESYESNLNYEKIVREHLSASDVLWQARAGYLGREESF